MSWLDEAVARRLQAQRDAESAKIRSEANAPTLLQRQQQHVEAFDPLIQRLLQEYGEFAFTKSLLQRHFVIRLEQPGQSADKSWNWHWHLYSLAKHTEGVEVHPLFDTDGNITGFTLQKGLHCLAISGHDETVLKDGLVSLYLS